MARHDMRKYVAYSNPGKPTWIIHLVMMGECDGCGEANVSPINENLVDCHSHGINKYGSHELQVVYKTSLQMIAYLINITGQAIKAGLKLKDGDLLDYLLDGYSVKIMETEDINGEKIFRLLLPDALGKFPGDEGCADVYNLQALSTKVITEGYGILS